MLYHIFLILRVVPAQIPFFLPCKRHRSLQNLFLINFLWFLPRRAFFRTSKYGAQIRFNCIYESFKSDIMITPTTLLTFHTTRNQEMKNGKLWLWKDTLYWCEKWYEAAISRETKMECLHPNFICNRWEM